MRRFTESDLENFGTRCFASTGMPLTDACVVSRALVSANLRGIDTHGVARIPAYLKRIRAGLINPRPEIRSSSPMPFSTIVDGDNAMGPVAASIAVEACMRAADTLGIGAATVRRSNHFGAASVYTVPATARGCVAIAMSPGAPSLAPHGSRAALFGTNPFALAVPAGRYSPWSLDMAASVAARGHIRRAAQEGRAIPEGWALDNEGAPTTNPEAALRGLMLPFAGAKGSGIAFMVDILAGVLAGSGFAGEVRDWNVDFTGPADVGHFFLVMKIEAFMPLGQFESRMETAIGRLKALPPAEGVEEVTYPGERSGSTESERRRIGIPLGNEVLRPLAELAAELGIASPSPTL
ncbi:Ldh family oxidoreductase [Microvirga antarctica]|uniref:Ldh family oxidoreductase n=1 Tax=Microvirga antarctica TaxID=2819233 RepID=UPI001B30552A|nr:Ldh family oxidoreductase [Microvirga antarctica]